MPTASAETTYGLSQRLQAPQIRTLLYRDYLNRSKEERYSDALAAILPPRVFRLDDPNGNILVASFAHNPTSNHYDYVYTPLIHDLEEDGLLNEGDELIEITSGNSGLAAAWAAKELGPYPLSVYVPGSLPNERLDAMRQLGATTIVTDGYMTEAAKRMRSDFKQLKSSGVWEAGQYRRGGDEKYPDYFVPYFINKTTGQKKLFLNHSEQMSTVRSFGKAFWGVTNILPKDVDVDAVFSVVGNGTTTQAMRRYLVGERQFAGAKLIGIENAANPVMYNKKYGIEKGEPAIGEIMPGMILPGMDWLTFQDPGILDDVALVSRDESRTAQRAWNGSVSFSEETIGETSAAGMIVARRYLEAHPGSTVLVWHYDTGEKYGGFVAPENTTLRGLTDFSASVYHPANRLRPRYRQPQYGSLEEMPGSLSETITSNR